MPFAYTQLASDTFHRGNEAPLNPANWTNFNVGTGLAVLNNVCVGRDSTGDAEFYTGVSFPSDQYSTVTLGQFASNSEVNIYVRTPFIGPGGYQAFFFGNGAGSFGIFLYGPGGPLGAFGLGGTPHSGDVLLLQAVGSTISVSYNGVKVISAVDSTTLVNGPGLGIKFSSVQTDTTVLSWAAGSVTSIMANPITINANLVDLTGNPTPGYMQAAVVAPSGVYDLFVSGSGAIVPRLSTSGVGTSVSVPIWGNDVVIDAATGLTDTIYTVTLFNSSNSPAWTASYLFTGTGPINLVGYPIIDSYPPLTSTIPMNILTGNNIFTGTNSFSNAFSVTGATTLTNVVSISGTEGSAATGAANQDVLWADSVAHRWKMNNNNVGADTVVGAATTDTLSNKTLASPVINTPTLNGSVGLLTLPAGPDTLVGRATTDTLTNKTLTSPALTTPTLSGVTNGTGLQLFTTATTCTTAASVGAICTTAAITLPVAYADSNYRLTCTGLTPTNVPIVQTYAKSNTTFTLTVAALTAAAASFASFDCLAVHN